MSSYVQIYPGSSSRLALPDDPHRDRKPDHLFCIGCLNSALEEDIRDEGVLSITCILLPQPEFDCEYCSMVGKPVCHTVSMRDLGNMPVKITKFVRLPWEC